MLRGRRVINTNVQDKYLNHFRKEKTSVVLHLTGGDKLKGRIKGFDNFVILLRNTQTHLVYKHSISTIVSENDTGSPDVDIEKPAANS